MLGDRTDAVWDGELFEPRRRSKVPELEAGLSPHEVIRTRRGSNEDKAYAFAVKYLWSHHLAVLGVDLPGLLELLEAGGVDHFVVIRRRNYLRRVVSGAVGRARGTYHQRISDGPSELTRVRLDLDGVPFGPGRPLFDVFEELARGERELGSILEGRRQLWLTYEDDIEDDPLVAYRRLCSFLGLPPQDVNVRLTRTTPFPLVDVLDNYDEVAAALATTPHAWMLED